MSALNPTKPFFNAIIWNDFEKPTLFYIFLSFKDGRRRQENLMKWLKRQRNFEESEPNFTTRRDIMKKYKWKRREYLSILYFCLKMHLFCSLPYIKNDINYIWIKESINSVLHLIQFMLFACLVEIISYIISSF